MNFLFHTEAGHFIIYIASMGFISTMPAPTAMSGVPYKWAFAFFNFIAINIPRALGPKIENSPNFQAALNIQQGVQGQPQTPVVPTPPTASAEEKKP